MGMREWLKSFKELHAAAKSGALSARDATQCRAARDELARALLSAQRIAVTGGNRPRRLLRVARALQADLEFHDGNVRAMTLDVSAGGFSALMERPPRVEDPVKASLRIPGAEPLRAEARVVNVKQQVGNSRVGFEFVGLGEEDVERLELFVFDAVLTQLQA